MARSSHDIRSYFNAFVSVECPDDLILERRSNVLSEVGTLPINTVTERQVLLETLLGVYTRLFVGHTTTDERPLRVHEIDDDSVCALYEPRDTRIGINFKVCARVSERHRAVYGEDGSLWTAKSTQHEIVASFEHELVHHICSFFDPDQHGRGSWPFAPPDPAGGHHRLFMSLQYNLFRDHSHTSAVVDEATWLVNVVRDSYWRRHVRPGHWVIIRNDTARTRHLVRSCRRHFVHLEGMRVPVEYRQIDMLYRQDPHGSVAVRTPSTGELRRRGLRSYPVHRHLQTAHTQSRLHEALSAYQAVPAQAMLRHLGDHSGHIQCTFVYYEPGVGKTRAAIHAAAMFCLAMFDKCPDVYCVTTAPNVETTWAHEQAQYVRGMRSDQRRQLARALELPSSTCEALSDFVTVASYQRFVNEQPVDAIRDSLLIIDEAHRLRNTGTQIAQTLATLCRVARYVICLSATPVYRDEQDLRNIQAVVQHPWEMLYRGTDTVDFARTSFRTMSVPLDPVDAVIDRRVFTEADREAIALYLRHHPTVPSHSTLESIVSTRTQTNPFLIHTRQWNNTDNKIRAMWAQIVADGQDAAHPRRRVLVFSHFVDRGIERFQRSRPKCCKVQLMVLRSQDSPVVRKETLDAFNRGDAVPGKTRVLLITPMAVEGLSLQNVGACHIMEPGWNAEEETQVVGRAVRKNSHAKLRSRGWDHVQVYCWVSVLPATPFEATTMSGTMTLSIHFDPRTHQTTDEHCSEQLDQQRERLRRAKVLLQDEGRLNQATYL